ncbi:MAG: branched-chain amino acid ABC transporter permease [Gammaproteobacteria bacterium]|nr:branched-chain amino acid ABC transporter permease [Gammaproteobacteria bacterium]
MFSSLPFPRRSLLSYVILLGVLGVLVPYIGGNYWLSWLAKILIFSIFAMSLQLLVGQVGLVSLGHAAYWGLGAYSVVLASQFWGWTSLLALGSLALGVGACYAFLVGLLIIRTKGMYFIMVTLAFAQMVYYVIHDTPLGGGTDGIFWLDKPSLGNWLIFDQLLPVYGLSFLSFVIVSMLLGYLQHTKLGSIWRGIAENEARMLSLGYQTFFYKWLAFVISGMVAAWAGFLIALLDGYVNPEMLSWHHSGSILMMVILGGKNSLMGAVLGVVLWHLLVELLQMPWLPEMITKHWLLALGILIIACVLSMPHGVAGLPRQVRLWLSK